MKWICYDGEHGANNIFHLQIMCFSVVPITESRITGSVYYMRILGIIIKTKIATIIILYRYDIPPRFRIPYIDITIFSIVKSKNQPRLLKATPEKGQE